METRLNAESTNGGSSDATNSSKSGSGCWQLIDLSELSACIFGRCMNGGDNSGGVGKPIIASFLRAPVGRNDRKGSDGQLQATSGGGSPVCWSGAQMGGGQAVLDDFISLVDSSSEGDEQQSLGRWPDFPVDLFPLIDCSRHGGIEASRVHPRGSQGSVSL